MKIFRCLCLHMKILCRRFRIITGFTFWVMRTRDIWNVCLDSCRNNRIYYKVAYFLRKTQTSRASNSRILRIRNAKFSGYCFYMNPNILGDFRICISVPLKNLQNYNRRSFLCPSQKYSQYFELTFFMITLHFGTSSYLHIEKWIYFS